MEEDSSSFIRSQYEFGEQLIMCLYEMVLHTSLLKMFWKPLTDLSIPLTIRSWFACLKEFSPNILPITWYESIHFREGLQGKEEWKDMQEKRQRKVKPHEMGTVPETFLKSLVKFFLASLHNNSTSFSLTWTNKTKQRLKTSTDVI